MPTIKVRDHNLYYEIHGAGEPLLMIMGLGASHAAWNPELVGELARSFGVIIFDNLGTGLSDKPADGYSIEGFADDADAMLEALGHPRAHVFGVSMGGMIAQELVLRHPARVHSLTLGCTTAGGRNAIPAPAESMKLLSMPRGDASEEDLIRRGWPLAYTESYRTNHQAELEATIPRLLANPTPARVVRGHLEATFKFKTFDRLPNITAPTLAVTGAEDVLIPPGNSEIIAGRIPDAEFHIIPNAAHSFFNEAPREFAAVLTPFLRAHPIR